ncbi:hypothetical protein LPJ61_003969 [Coemansia biformis]|uniref:Major facilitator superfamily (MFS) profile domain-containing protein n=1 Tax=Coemansia biformis TaxID=1286918 RepID=A0A9W8CX75_9FUNG|nr:hypothetical protein LPJ61_003969 [Coemansia biformis]
MSAECPKDVSQRSSQDTDAASHASDPSDKQSDDAHAEAPYSPFSARTRMMIVAITALTGLVSPLSSNMYYPSIISVKEDLGTTQSGVTWTVSSFIIAMAVFPLIWSNLADYIGRKPVYALSMLIFTCGSIGCALSHNLTALIASRIVQSAGASAVQGAGAGTISDVFPREQRGTALGIYYLGPLFGPCLGPLIGGYIGQNVGWRWVFWVLVIWGGVMILLAVFVLPETHRRIVAKRYVIQQLHIPPKLGLKDNNPLLDIATVRYPVIALTMFHYAMLFGTYFTNATVQPLAYDKVYGLSQGTSGLCFLASGVGCLIGSTGGGYITDVLLRRCRRRSQPAEPASEEAGEASEPTSTAQVPAEARLGAMWIGSAVFLCGIIICGWLVENNLSLAGVLVTQFFIGTGMAFTFQSLGGYLIDIYPSQSARITGVQNFWRSAWAAAVVQLSPTMLTNIGWGWTYTTMFSLTLTSLMLMQIVVFRGGALRKRFGPGADIK